MGNLCTPPDTGYLDSDRCCLMLKNQHKIPETVKYRDAYTKRIKCYSIAGHRDMIDRKIHLETGVKCMVEYHYIHKRKIIRHKV